MSRYRPTWEERQRLEDYVVEWSLKRRSVTQIARALGVSIGVVTAARNERRHQLEGKKISPPKYDKLPDPPDYDWLAPPPPKVERSYEINSPLPRMEGLLDYLRNSNAKAKLPHNMEEAFDAGDAAWYLKIQIVNSDLIKVLQELGMILESRTAFNAALLPSARDDLSRKRVVSNNPASEQHFPARGSGEMPGRLYAQMMGAYWAGIPMDDAWINHIARKEHSNPERVRRALIEFERAMKENPL